MVASSLHQDDIGQIGSELFDVSRSTDRVRPWHERRMQARAVAAAYEVVFERTGDLDVHRIAERCGQCGTALEFEDLYAECIDATKLRLKQANFCRARLCPMCNWRRSLKLKHELRSVLDALGVGVTHRTLMLTLTEPNSEAEDLRRFD